MKRVTKAIPAVVCSTSLFILAGCSNDSGQPTAASVQPASSAGQAAAETSQPTAAAPTVAEAADRRTARNMGEQLAATQPNELSPQGANSLTAKVPASTTKIKPTEIRVEERVALNPDGTVASRQKVDPNARAAREDAAARIKAGKPDNSQFVNAEAPVVVRAEPPQLFLGEVSTGDAGTGTIKLVNSGDKPMRLIECKSSCGCTTTNCPTGEVIPPGGSLDLPVRMNAGAMPQENMTKTLTYIVEDHPLIAVPVSAKVVSFLAVTPETLDTDASLDGKLTLRAIDDQPFVITSMVPPIITEFATEPAAEQTLEIDWDTFVNSGVRGGSRLVIYTNHPKCRAAYVNVRGIKAREAAAKYAETRNAQHPTRQAPNTSAVHQPTVASTIDPNMADQFKAHQATLTPVNLRLHALTKSEDVDGMKQAIADGADVSAADAGGKAPIHIAAAEGKSLAIDALVEAGADIEARDRGGRTAIMWAVESRNPAVVTRLVELGADLTARDETGGNALMWAAGFGNTDTLQAILNTKPDLAATDDHGMTALMWAASFGDGARVKMLVDAGINVNLVDGSRGCSALMYAARSSGSIETVKALIDSGADLSIVDVSGRTALCWAAILGTPEKVQMLLDAGADVAKEDFRGWSALKYAENRRDRNGPVIVSLLKEATAKAGGETDKAAEAGGEPVDPQARAN